MTKTNDLFESITARIVEAIESNGAGNWTKPWTSVLAGSGLPTNASTKKTYLGMNALIGMIEQGLNDYETSLWATYKQWQGIGAQVRKGETGTKMVKWGVSYRCATHNYKGQAPCKTGGTHKSEKNVWASSFTVFNADQVDGYDAVALVTDGLSETERLDHVDAFIAATGANIRHMHSDSAYYDRVADRITLPLAEQFGTTRDLYGTTLHELTHWTGAEHRLAREKGKTFGDSRYAWEELVAELGATFLAAHFGIEVEPHGEHAAYLASWLRTIKGEPRALYRAAKQAQEAMTFLLDEANKEAEVAA